MKKSKIIETLNCALTLLPKENEITDDLEDVIKLLEAEWLVDFEDDEF